MNQESKQARADLVGIGAAILAIVVTVLFGLTMYLFNQVSNIASRATALEITTSEIQGLNSVLEDMQQKAHQLDLALLTITHGTWSTEAMANLAGSFVIPALETTTDVGREVDVKILAQGVTFPTSLWLLVHPIGEEGYWPCEHPLELVNGECATKAYLGMIEEVQEPKEYLVLLVAADQTVGREFQEYIQKHKEQAHYPALSWRPGVVVLDTRVFERTH